MNSCGEHPDRLGGEAPAGCTDGCDGCLPAVVLSPNSYVCSICFEILLDPVVGRCLALRMCAAGTGRRGATRKFRGHAQRCSNSLVRPGHDATPAPSRRVQASQQCLLRGWFQLACAVWLLGQGRTLHFLRSVGSGSVCGGGSDEPDIPPCVCVCADKCVCSFVVHVVTTHPRAPRTHNPPRRQLRP